MFQGDWWEIVFWIWTWHFGTAEPRPYNQFNASQYGHSQFNDGGGFIGGIQRTSMMARPSYHPYREREDEIGSNELLERDVVGTVLLTV